MRTTEIAEAGGRLRAMVSSSQRTETGHGQRPDPGAYSRHDASLWLEFDLPLWIPVDQRHEQMDKAIHRNRLSGGGTMGEGGLRSPAPDLLIALAGPALAR